MNLKRKLSIILTLVVVASLAVAAYELGGWTKGSGVEVDGGSVVFQTEDKLEIRCLSSDVTLTTDGFSGDVTFHNCFPGSVLEGFEGEMIRNGTSISFESPGGQQSYRLLATEQQEFSFAVMSDSQGHNDILKEALNMTEDCDFVIHCGDLTPSGSTSELASVEEALNSSESPVFTTPGNHDVKTYGPSGYMARFGPTEYAFDYGGVRLAFVDSSSGSITSKQISWLGETFSGADTKVIITHTTSYDPFEGNHTLDPDSCERLQEFSLQNDIAAVFSGHVHGYNILRVDRTDFVITGGAGGSLTAGTYHWLRVDVSAAGFAYEKVDVDHEQTLPSGIRIAGHGLAVNLTLDELRAMLPTEGDSSYQNQFGNVVGAGHYLGVTVSSLMSLVGGMTDAEVLKVIATDGYYQEYGYRNVYPNDTWLSLQGPMILALEYDGTGLPSWGDGPRIAMLAPDGLYGNSDCNETSYPGQGYSVYQSAGARWVKNVSVIEVVSPP